MIWWAISLVLALILELIAIALMHKHRGKTFWLMLKKEWGEIIVIQQWQFSANVIGIIGFFAGTIFNIWWLQEGGSTFLVLVALLLTWTAHLMEKEAKRINKDPDSKDVAVLEPILKLKFVSFLLTAFVPLLLPIVIRILES